MINFDEKFWLAIAFCTFAALIIKFVKPIICKALGDKSQAIAQEILDAKEMKDKAQKLLSEAEKYCSESKQYSEKLLKDAEAEAKKFATESKEQIEAEVAKKTAASITRIKSEEEAAIRKIKNKIVSSTINTISENISKEMTQDHQDHLIKEAASTITKSV